MLCHRLVQKFDPSFREVLFFVPAILLATRCDFSIYKRYILAAAIAVRNRANDDSSSAKINIKWVTFRG